MVKSQSKSSTIRPKSKSKSKVKSKTKSLLKNQYKIVIYGAYWCPFCVQSKEYSKNTLKSDPIFIEVNDLKAVERNLKLNKKIPKSISLNSIPVIFVNDKYIGGFDNLKNKY